MNIAAQVRARVAALPGDWAERLTHHLKELADLAEIHPICHAREAPVQLQMWMDRLQVDYEVDRDHRLLTVTGLSFLSLAASKDPGASNVA